MHYIVSSQNVQACMNALMDVELVVLSVSTDSWETEAINKGMVGKESYRYRYSVWIETLAFVGLCNAFRTQDIMCCSVE